MITINWMIRVERNLLTTFYCPRPWVSDEVYGVEEVDKKAARGSLLHSLFYPSLSRALEFQVHGSFEVVEDIGGNLFEVPLHGLGGVLLSPSAVFVLSVFEEEGFTISIAEGEGEFGRVLARRPERMLSLSPAGPFWKRWCSWRWIS